MTARDAAAPAPLRRPRSLTSFDFDGRAAQPAGVLREIPNVKQERGPGRRRWFESDGFDLVIWLDGHDVMTGFQICYRTSYGERALTWRPETGFVHSAVDSGDDTPFKNQTPILTPDGAVPWAHLQRAFDERAQLLEPTLRRFVREKLAASVA